MFLRITRSRLKIKVTQIFTNKFQKTIKIQQDPKQPIQKQVQHSTLIVDDGYVGQEGQTHQPMITQHCDNYTDLDSDVDPIHSDRGHGGRVLPLSPPTSEAGV